MTSQTISIENPARAVIEGVPRVRFYEGGPRCPEDIILPSCLRAILEFLGEKDYGCKHCRGKNLDCKVFCSYSFMVGVTGAGSYLSWKDGWAEDNQAIIYMSADSSAPEQHAFSAIGYAYEMVEKQPGDGDEALFSQKIVESILKGMPVLAYGVIGPPEPCILTGYDESGEVIIGWNFFQNFPDFGAGLEFEPNGYFRKRNWYQDTQKLLVIGEKGEKPSFREIYREALKWAVQVSRTPIVRPGPNAPKTYQDRHNGLTAYTAWAKHLLRDDDFPPDDEAILRQRYAVNDGAVSTIAHCRWYGSQFLIEAPNFDLKPPLSLAEDIYCAAGCYAAEHDLMWKIWELEGGIGNPEGWRKLADPAIRRQIVEVISQAHEKDVQAVQHIERTLENWKS